jgi:hypothetical protein
MKIAQHWRMSFGLVVMSLVMLTLVGADLYANDSDAVAAQPGEWSEVRVFTVSPSTRAVAVLAPNAQTPPAPVSLSAEERITILQSSSVHPDDSAMAQPDTKAVPTERFILSAALTFHEGKGILTLVRPYTVHPETGIHMRGTDSGSVGIKVHVEEGSQYLLDFSVKSAVPGLYTVKSEGVEQEVSDPDGAREHVLLVINAEKTGWTTIRLNRVDTDFMLYAVEITGFQ